LVSSCEKKGKRKRRGASAEGIERSDGRFVCKANKVLSNRVDCLAIIGPAMAAISTLSEKIMSQPGIYEIEIQPFLHLSLVMRLRRGRGLAAQKAKASFVPTKPSCFLKPELNNLNDNCIFFTKLFLDHL